jgi:protein SCO1/2
MYNIEKDNKTKALSKNITTTGKPALGGPWVLVDQDGIPRSDASYFGQFTLLYFGFTYCPDICPSELVKIGDIMKAIGNYDQQHFTSNYYSLSSSYHTTREIKRYSVEASAYLRGPL